MANLFTTAIADTAASAAAVTPMPSTLDVDFGSDIRCTDDTDALFSELPGDDSRLVGESVYRILTSDVDSIPGAPGVGFDLRGLLRQPTTASSMRSWPGKIRAAVLDADDRVESLDVDIKQTGTDAYEVTIAGVCASGTFDLVGQLTPTGFILQELTA